jgi:2-polyprenyl-3-methyl-5-hydroxy-6-metoxy-1,4-benzoquinol methylase
MKFKFRSYEKELLDNDKIDRKDLFQNLHELHVINQYLGGYNASINGLDTIQKNTKNIKNILDIGFGGGDSIKMFANYYKNQEDSLFFYGVDLKEDCIEYATKNLASISNNKLICDNYKNIGTELLSKIDVIHCSLFLHHLTDDEIIDLFKFIKTNKCILLVNDLHRNWLAYYSIKFLTMIFSKSYLVKNDAPLSVLRGFKKDELTLLLKNSGFTNYEVNWNWAFRYSIIAYS